SHVARDDAVQEPRGVAAGDAVLVQGRDVEQRRRVADRVVFPLVRELVGTGDDVPGPAAPGVARAQRRRARVERCGLQHIEGKPRAGVLASRKTTVYDAPARSRHLPQLFQRASMTTTDNASSTSAGAPRQVLDLKDAIALVVGIVVGAGIFKAPALVANFTGTPELMMTAW